MKPPLKRISFASPAEIIDPQSAQFQQGLASKAGILAESLLDEAIGENDIRVKATALNAYAKYKTALDNDTSAILDKLAQMNDKQVGVLERALKQKSVLEDVRRGKFALEDVYGLPTKKKK